MLDHRKPVQPVLAGVGVGLLDAFVLPVGCPDRPHPAAAQLRVQRVDDRAYRECPAVAVQQVEVHLVGAQHLQAGGQLGFDGNREVALRHAGAAHTLAALGDQHQPLADAALRQPATDHGLAVAVAAPGIDHGAAVRQVVVQQPVPVRALGQPVEVGSERQRGQRPLDAGQPHQCAMPACFR